MEKINICFTSPSKNAYSETFIQNLKRIIDGKVFHCFGGFFPIESEDGKLKNHYSAPLIVKAFSKLGWIKRPIREIYLESYLKRNKIHAIIANYGQSGAELSNLSKKLNIPLIVHFHGYDASVKDVIERYRDKYLRMFEIAKAIVVVSSEMKDTIIRLGTDEKKVFLIRYAPAEAFMDIIANYQSDQMIAIGRFVEKKAPYLTLLAFKQAQEKCPELKLKLIGEGDLQQVCKDLSLALKIKNIDFAGIQKPEDIVTEMSQSFCFIQHSKTAVSGDKEGTPVAVLEAMSAGLPVISTYHAGIPDVIQDNENGLLVQEGDVDGMAQAIVKLYQDRKLAEQFGINNKEYIKANLLESQYKLAWNSLIQEVVHGK
ncbi:Glycosyltransferase involved in cell wall bisynthesis [Belliella buryatensis]|uniref:Glycosyltransferase involved in cell wall bisynthesis n=1 Tax=Belliella buryatensis TaxID=1500549 RepID=A0A239CUB8_9BACT|nr:glycosyltransferase family 4 protein [Belliella buryatensis]SNS23677.1 Glycosyltransferase involved in cell wall bisynthesis [Belliella buryatensis]